MLGSQLHLTWMLIASVYEAWSGRLKLSEFHPQEELSSGILWGRLILILFSGLPHLIQISLTDFFFLAPWHSFYISVPREACSEPSAPGLDWQENSYSWSNIQNSWLYLAVEYLDAALHLPTLILLQVCGTLLSLIISLQMCLIFRSCYQCEYTYSHPLSTQLQSNSSILYTLLSLSLTPQMHCCYWESKSIIFLLMCSL